MTDQEIIERFPVRYANDEPDQTIRDAAVTIDRAVEDSRAKSIALTKLEECLLWIGRATAVALFFALSGCAGLSFGDVIGVVDPQLVACQEIKEREPRSECIEAIVESVEDALELAREVREQNR